MLRNLQGEGAANEIEVGEEGAAEDYAEHAFSLLKVRHSVPSWPCMSG